MPETLRDATHDMVGNGGIDAPRAPFDCSLHAGTPRAAPSRVTRWPALAAVITLTACSVDDVVAVQSGADSRATATYARSDPDAVFLLEVDDSTALDAVILRAAIASMLRTTVEQLGDNGNWYDPQRRDPAAWHPVAIRIVLVFPSSSGSSIVFGPNDDARLAMVADDSSMAEIDALVGVVEDELAAHVMPPGTPYRPIDAAMRTLELFAGTRVPLDEHESGVLAAIGGARTSVSMSVVSFRDDEGSDAERAGVELAHLESPAFHVSGAIFSPVGGERDGPCTLPKDTKSRLGQWVDSAPARLEALSLPCATGQGASLAPPLPTDTAGLSCPPFASSACIILWSAPNLSSCDPALGLEDPPDADGVRRPQTTMVDSVEQRSCEIHALDGDDLILCETSLTCEGCAPGWCRTLLAIEPQVCSDRGDPFRFIGAAAMRGAGHETITCDVTYP